MVTFDMPYSVSGVTEKNYHGTGVIVDAKRGLVVIDRNTVPLAMGDVRMTFNGTVEVPGKVEFIHPLHNLAVVSYDPQSIGDTPVRAATFLSKELRPGDDVWVVGQRSDSKMMSQRTQVASVDAGRIPAVAHAALPGQQSGGREPGQCARRSGRRAGRTTKARCWRCGRVSPSKRSASSSRSIAAFRPISSREMIDVVVGRPAALFVRGGVQRAVARRARAGSGCPTPGCERFEQHDPQRRQVLGIDRLVAGAPAAALLEPGDLLLAIDGKVVNRFREVERAVQKTAGRGHGVARRRREDPADEDRAR